MITDTQLAYYPVDKHSVRLLQYHARSLIDSEDRVAVTAQAQLELVV
jgi:hypothetical protein